MIAQASSGWRSLRRSARVLLRLEGDMAIGEDPGVGEAARRPGRGNPWLRAALVDVEAFSATVLGLPLRPYQAQVARAVLAAIDDGRGDTLTVLMPRQSGKNELSAHLEAYLLTRRERKGGSIVKCAPTFKPQAL